MLFNSYIFIFAFLPTTLLGFYCLGRLGKKELALSWLILASLFFYGWWNPAYLALILASIFFNFILGRKLSETSSKLLLSFGILCNLSLLAYFKYANFFVDNLNFALGSDFHLEKIILPLAISFFTFQQITYLVDAYRGLTREYNFIHYCLFVTFFPQLIAGPIVHHKDMLPQFERAEAYQLRAENLAVGLSIFIVGLFKKVVLADNIALHATPVFDAAEAGYQLTLADAWLGALAYSLQLYFDFSGYSDMAIGLARLFGITLPINFYSPYKAKNIIDFWRRWHITLSGFLRDYLYIPLGGNRRGKTRRYANLLLTMLLGGLWHGAGWTFLIWGGLHGLYLVINHLWLNLKANLSSTFFNSKIFAFFAGLLTFIAVVFAWVIFRAESLAGASLIYQGMLGLQGFAPSIRFAEADEGLRLVILLLLIIWFTPNTMDWFRREKPALNYESTATSQKESFTWRHNLLFAFVISLIAVIAVMSLQNESEFLYFQF